MMRSKLTTLTGLMITIFLVSYLIQAQNPTSPVQPPASAQQDTKLLGALLDEVRQLRLTMEKTNGRDLRSQIILRRIGRQEDRVGVLTLELDRIRVQIKQTSNPSRYDDVIKEAEAAIHAAVAPQTRAQLLQEFESLKIALERQKRVDQQELEQLREREIQLEMQLRTEQARLGESQEQLDTLERESATQVAETRKT